MHAEQYQRPGSQVAERSIERGGIWETANTRYSQALVEESISRVDDAD